jgi:hypothetical protein
VNARRSDGAPSSGGSDGQSHRRFQEHPIRGRLCKAIAALAPVGFPSLWAFVDDATRIVLSL